MIMYIEIIPYILRIIHSHSSLARISFSWSSDAANERDVHPNRDREQSQKRKEQSPQYHIASFISQILTRIFGGDFY